MSPVFETILNEAMSREEYLSGFKVLLDNDRYREAAEANVDWALKTLVKNSRILWFLRILKLKMFNNHGVPEKYLEREKRKLKNSLSDEEYNSFMIGVHYGTISWLRTQLEHHFLGPLSRKTEIVNYEFGTKSVLKALEELEAIEEKYRIEDSELFIEPHRILSWHTVKYREGWEEFYGSVDDAVSDRGNMVWLTTINARSDLLARAMSDSGGTGHCGTCQENTSEILVLAEFLDEDRFVPHLTFELSEKGYILQSKGYRNGKPSERYHPYIVELLANSDRILRVVGGNYKPETDFKMEDLSEEDRERVLSEKPDIDEPLGLRCMAIWDDNGPSDSWMEALRDEFSPHIEFYDEVSDPTRSEFSRSYGVWVQIPVSKVRDFLAVIHDDLKSLVQEWSAKSIKGGIGIEDLNRKGWNSYEDPTIGAELEDHVNPGMFRSVIESAMGNSFFTRYLSSKKIDTSNREEFIEKVTNGTYRNVYELIRRAVLFGLASNSVTGYDERFAFAVALLYEKDVDFMEIELRDNGNKSASLSELVDFEQFLNLNVFLICTAGALADEIEHRVNSLSQQPLPGSFAFGEDWLDMAEDHRFFMLKGVKSFKYYIESPKSKEIDRMHRIVDDRFHQYSSLSSKPTIRTDTDQSRFDFHTGNEYVVELDTDAAVAYIEYKIRRNVPESLSRLVLGTIRG